MTLTSVPDQPPAGDGEETFETLAAALPETAQGFLDAALPQEPESVWGGPTEGADELTPSDPTAPARKRVNVSKKVRRAMNRFKGKVADVPIMWFHQQAKGEPTWELDDEEKELLKDAVDTVFEVLDVEVEIQPLSWTLTSVWWVIGYPFLAFAFLFLTKKSLVMEKQQQENV